jgi:hypothetical protein
MTTPTLLLRNIIDPLMPFLSLSADIAIPSSDAARVLLLVISGQESNWKYRLQNNGPARSYWQFEKGGGLAGVFNLFPKKVAAICSGFDVPCDLTTIFEAMAWHDQLAASMARLLLWSDPRPLPVVGDANGAWQYYLDTWRPGLPHLGTWPTVYETALSLIQNKGV